jgi:3'(2'), 5'-bisphosphate nucleotidase
MSFDASRPEVRVALGAVRDAALIAENIRGDLDAIRTLIKTDKSPVTVADFAAQALVGRALLRAFPQAAVVGEESADALRRNEQPDVRDLVTQFVRTAVPGATFDEVCAWIDHGKAIPGGRFWTLDPIDGTKGYLRGGQYAVALALIDGATVDIGVLACPALPLSCDPAAPGAGVLVVAVRGEGTWCTDLHEPRTFRRLHVSDCADIRHARVLRSFETGHTNVDELDDIMTRLAIEAPPVAMDSQAKYAVLAAGRGDLLFRLLSAAQPKYEEQIWDQAAGSIVVEEAGGRISDLDGKPLDFTQGATLANNRGVLASNGRLHDAVRAAIHSD